MDVAVGLVVAQTVTLFFAMGDMVVVVVVHKGGSGGSIRNITYYTNIYIKFISRYSNNSFNTQNFIHQPVGC
jgi:hypothetical protein